MKTLIPTLVLLLFSSITLAQQSKIREYLDENCKSITDTSKAVYYRIVEEKGISFIVRDYFMSGELEMVAECSNIDKGIIKDGTCVWYHKNGKIKREGFYTLDFARGLHKEYYENGQPESEVFYTESKSIHYQHWTEAGEPLLVNGTGFIKTKYNDQVNHQEIVDSVTVNSFSVRQGTTDTVYTSLTTMPEYVGGYDALIRDIRANMVYPKPARRKGIEGTVYVQFVIDKQGKVTEPRVIRGISPDCDEVALNAVSKLRTWNPGMVRKQPVFVRFVLPVKFKLK